MHKVIKEILDKDTATQKKAEEIAELKASVEIAERIFLASLLIVKSVETTI